MLLLLNTTKTMDFSAPVLPDMATADPGLLKTAQKLAGNVSKMTPLQLAELMSLSDKLAAETHEKFSLWGKPEQSKIPALFGFTGLIFKHLNASSLSKNQLIFARKNVRILSGLYGLLEPFDLTVPGCLPGLWSRQNLWSNHVNWLKQKRIKFNDMERWKIHSMPNVCSIYGAGI